MPVKDHDLSPLPLEPSGEVAAHETGAADDEVGHGSSVLTLARVMNRAG
jgi:hypothetical protein